MAGFLNRSCWNWSSFAGAHLGNSDSLLNKSSKRFDQAQSDLLEIKVAFNPEAASDFRLKIRCSKGPSRFVRIACDGEHLEVKGDKAPAKLMQDEKTLRLQLFLGRDCMEIFAHAWIVYTESIAVPLTDLGIELFSAGGGVNVKRGWIFGNWLTSGDRMTRSDDSYWSILGIE